MNELLSMNRQEFVDVYANESLHVLERVRQRILNYGINPSELKLEYAERNPDNRPDREQYMAGLRLRIERCRRRLSWVDALIERKKTMDDLDEYELIRMELFSIITRNLQNRSRGARQSRVFNRLSADYQTVLNNIEILRMNLEAIERALVE